MKIDANTASGPPAPVQKSGPGSARHRAGGETAAESPGTASFMSLLHGLAAPLADPGLTVVHGSVPSGQDNGTGDGEAVAQAAADALDGAAPLANPAPVVLVPTQPDAAAARADGTGAVSADDAYVDDGSATASTAETQALQAWRAALDAAANTGATKQGAAAADASALARQQAADAAMAAGEWGGRADAATLAKDAMEESTARPLVTPQAGANAASVMSMFEAGLLGLRAGPGARVQERGAARVGHGQDVATGGFVPWADAGPGHSASQAANPVYAPTAATPAPATALAQKMHFWVAGGVQSAELQLDAFGGGSVDVHIAVKGDEAYVEFRSDQPQARKLLLDAMPQLKELMAGEGLLLSGGFVGGSAQHDNEGGSTRRDRFPGTRSAQERVVQGPATALPLVRAPVGSAVDLFV